jgi:Zn-dependent protease
VTPAQCERCGTELPPAPLACPVCGALVYASRLKELAARATAAEATGDLATARERWNESLQWLPPSSQQHAVVRERVADLQRRTPTASSAAPTTTAADGRSWWARTGGAIAATGLLLAGKLKFLLLGLTKLGTFLSMFAFFGVYWSIYGWPLALGLVVSIYIHEMGHVAMLRRLGIESSAPMFIPGVGAIVMLKQHVDDASVDAQIGLAGPLWGLGAAVTAAMLFAVTGVRVWLAIAQLTAFLNLFNLIPIWQLDGSRGFHALSRTERWTIVAVIVGAFVVTAQSLLLLVGAVAVWRALQTEEGPGDRRALVTFAVLVMALSTLARNVR